jgi:hypothetical protein
VNAEMAGKPAQVESPSLTFSMLGNWLLRDKDVSTGAKLVYGRLEQFKGKNGIAWPSLGTLAFELAASKRQVIRWIKQLEARGLVSVARTTGGRSVNQYSLPEHPMMEENNSNIRRLRSRGDTMSPQGCQDVTAGVTPCHRRGVILAPE